MTNPILEFIDKRKQEKLKKPGAKTLEEIEAQFVPKTWIADAARRASQLQMVSHPGKFSHPDAKVTPVHVAADKPSCDGYIHSGCCDVPSDVLGNAAALDVYAFLTVELTDGRTVLQHIESRSDLFRQYTSASNSELEEWRSGFLEIKSGDEIQKTAPNVKQVYFPVDDDYHLLSVLTSSGLVTVNRERLRTELWSDEANETRDARKKGLASDHTLKQIPRTLAVKYGGTQPQNISRLNSANAGEALLLPCLPPSLDPKYIRRPRRDFFNELRWDAELKFVFDSVHRIFQTDYNNKTIRDARRHWFESIFEWVYARVFPLQQLDPLWSDGSSLPTSQQVWLDQGKFELRDETDDWQLEIAEGLVRWSVVAYRRYKKDYAAALGEVEESRFREEALSYSKSIAEELS